MSFKDQDEQEAAAFNEKLNAQARQLSRPPMTDTPTPTAPETELLPCPFCGGPANLCEPPFGRPYVACLENFCSGPKERAEDALAAWNRRTPDAADLIALRAEVATLRAEVERQKEGVSHWLTEARRCLKSGQEALTRAELAEAATATLRASEARMRGALVELAAVSERAIRLSAQYDDFKLYAMEPMDHAINLARAALQGETK
jgi:hypothetical protein